MDINNSSLLRQKIEESLLFKILYLEQALFVNNVCKLISERYNDVIEHDHLQIQKILLNEYNIAVCFNQFNPKKSVSKSKTMVGGGNKQSLDLYKGYCGGDMTQCMELANTTSGSCASSSVLLKNGGSRRSKKKCVGGGTLSYAPYLNYCSGSGNVSQCVDVEKMNSMSYCTQTGGNKKSKKQLRKYSGGSDNYSDYCSGSDNLSQCMDTTVVKGVSGCYGGGRNGKKSMRKQKKGGGNLNYAPYLSYCSGSGNVSQCVDVEKMNSMSYCNQKGGGNLNYAPYLSYCSGSGNVSQCVDIEKMNSMSYCNQKGGGLINLVNVSTEFLSKFSLDTNFIRSISKKYSSKEWSNKAILIMKKAIPFYINSILNKITDINELSVSSVIDKMPLLKYAINNSSQQQYVSQLLEEYDA